MLLHDADRSPAPENVYFVRGNSSHEPDLRRAGIEAATAAIVCPGGRERSGGHAVGPHRVGIESIAPDVRTVVEVNNPDHVPRFRRANVNEIMVTSKLATHLLARSAMYPGLSELVTDIVSGGEGSELYRVGLPIDYVGLSVVELASKLRTEHRATLLAISRDGTTLSNPGPDFLVAAEDDLVVVAESLGDLELYPASTATG